MVEEVDQFKIAAGSYHSCLICKRQKKGDEQPISRLYVWGLNNERHLVADGKQTLTSPQVVRLECNEREYEPVSVVNGPSFSLVIGEINLAEEIKYLRQKKQQSGMKKVGIVGNPNLGSQSISELYMAFKSQGESHQSKRHMHKDGSFLLAEQNLNMIQSHF